MDDWGGLAGTLIAVILVIGQSPLIPLLLPPTGLGVGAYIKREGYIINQKQFEKLLTSLHSLAKKALEMINDQNKQI